MRIVTDTKKFAPIINFKKMPVIEIDFADADEYGIVSKPVNIDAGKFRDGEPHYVRSHVRAYCDEKKFTFSSYGDCIHAGFGYEDMNEILQYANAPIVHADEDVMIAIVDSKNRKAYAPIVMHTGKRVEKFCSTPLTFVDEDNDATAYLLTAGVKLRDYNG